MKIRVGLMVAVIILAGSFGAPAQNATVGKLTHNETLWVFGHGKTQCGDWIDARAGRSGDSWVGMLLWVEGFLSGYNRYVSSTGFAGKGINSNSLAVLIDSHCKDRPIEPLLAITERLAFELERQSTE